MSLPTWTLVPVSYIHDVDSLSSPMVSAADGDDRVQGLLKMVV